MSADTTPEPDHSVRVSRFEYGALCAIAAAAEAVLQDKSVADEGGVEHPLNTMLGKLRAYRAIRAGHTPLSPPMACSFCGKPRDATRHLIGGAASPALICGGCIITSTVIIQDDEVERLRTDNPGAPATTSAFEVTLDGVGERDDDEPWAGVGGPTATGLLLKIGNTRVFVPAPIRLCRDLAAYLYGPPLRARVVLELPTETPSP